MSWTAQMRIWNVELLVVGECGVGKSPHKIKTEQNGQENNHFEILEWTKGDKNWEALTYEKQPELR